MKNAIKTYRWTLAFAFKSWRTWLVIYCFQLVFSYVLFYPLSAWMHKIIGQSTAIEELAASFDFNIIMDMLHAHGSALGIWFALATLTGFLYFGVQNLIVGGITGMFKSYNRSIIVFCFNGARYFLKNLAISIAFLIVFLFLVILGYMIFSIGGLHVLDLESETHLIMRFYIILPAIVILLFFIGISRDATRVLICRDDSRSLLSDFRMSMSLMFRSSYIVVSLLDFILLGLFFWLFFLLNSAQHLEDGNLILLLFSQIFLLFRIILRITRLGSFSELSKDYSFSSES